jgi:hypothetical protein
LPLLDALLPLLDPQPATAASVAAPIAAAAISRDFIRSPHLQENWSRHFSMVGQSPFGTQTACAKSRASPVLHCA